MEIEKIIRKNYKNFLRNVHIQKKKKKWRLYNDCYTESDKKIAGPRFELGLSGL